MAVGLAGAAAALPALALPRGWPVETLVLICLGVACAFLLTPTLPRLADAAEQDGEHSYGCAYSLFNLANASGMLLGPLAGGVLTARLGFLPCLLLVGGAAALCVPWLPSARA
jgi:predicted MFS family arabinose efflux permease